MRLDPVILEILANKAVAAAVEMATVLQRTSRTMFVKEAADFACALIGVDGRVFAHPPTSGVSLFVDLDANATIAAVPDLGPGDVILTNDPYLSGSLATHLPDLTVVAPYFHDGRLVGYGWTFIHSTDVGGAVPNSLLASLHEVYQEGIRFPPVKLVQGGVLNEDVFAFLRANSRIPDDNEGDVKAMLAALRRGEQRTSEIIARHGVDAFLACQDDLQDYSAAKARAVLRRIPDGVYEFWNYMDDDLVSPIPVRIRLRMTVDDGRIQLDLTGTDPQVKAAYNICTMDRMHEWLTLRFIAFVCTHDPSCVLNHGVFRWLTVTNLRGTIMNAEFPAAIGIRDAPARRLSDAVTGAILKAAPELMAAPSAGAAYTFVIAGPPEDGTGEREVAVVEPLRGGMGAFVGSDGVDGRDSSMSNLRNNPLEMVESDYGVVVRRYDIRPDSGGPGRWRGGVGQMMTVEVFGDGGTIFGRAMEWLRFAPFGVMGGMPAAPLRIIVNEGRDDEIELSKFGRMTVNAGDTVTVMLPGGAGYGDPLVREPEHVLRDVRQGFVTAEGAMRDYAVVVRSGAIDVDATEALRRTRRGDNVGTDFEFGLERESWESVFDDETMNELTAKIFELPASVRQERRRWIFAQAVPDLPQAGGGRSMAPLFADPDAVRGRLAAAMESVFGEPGGRAAK